MESYRTDEEQVEALKKWWDENGTATLVTIALVLASVFGWQTWQQRKLDASNAASVVYQELLDSVATEEKLDETKTASIAHVVKEIQTDFKNTTYAQYAGLLMARIHVEQNKLDEARAELEQVLDLGPKKDLEPLVRLRLARVVFAQGEGEAALSMLSNVETGAFAASYAELKGDIQQELGDLGDARESYQQAVNHLAGAEAQLVQLKLANVERLLAAPQAKAAAAQDAVDAVSPQQESGDQAGDGK